MHAAEKGLATSIEHEVFHKGAAYVSMGVLDVHEGSPSRPSMTFALSERGGEW